MQRQQYKEEQQQMINDVTEKTVILQQNSLKRKNEEEKLAKEKAEIAKKHKEIEELRAVLTEKEQYLEEKNRDLQRHRIFSTFLESVVHDKSGDKEGFTGIDDLQDRFKSLKSENKTLMSRKQAINQEMEEARAREKSKLNELKATLYDQQRKMQTIQSELEVISAKNSVLEQDFENEIGKKNQNSKEIGQIINSINNIFNICQIQQAKRGKKLAKPDGKVNEETENLVEELIASLDRSHQTVDELVQVHRAYGRDYDREKAYTEDIDAQIAA